MNVISVVALCIMATVICKVLERDNKEISVLIGVFVAGYILLMVVISFSDISDTIDTLFSKASISEEYIEILFKAVGISYVTQLGCDCCRDSGENAMCTGVELFGKITILLISLPIYSAVISLIEELLN